MNPIVRNNSNGLALTNWRTVDWSLSDAELAVRYECAEHTVRTERSYWQRPVNGRGANDARSWPKPPETVDPVEFYRARCGV